MANETPDLSRIVNLILSNPKLIEEIQTMVKQQDDNGSEETVGATEDLSASRESEAPADPPPQAERPEDASVSATAEAKLHRETRAHLLRALKPYLSDNRRRAVDSMLQIADLLDVFRTVR